MFCRNCGKEFDEKAALCPNCGVRPQKGTKFCNNCGAPTKPEAEFCVKCGVKLATDNVSSKSRLATTLLALFLGYVGAHRFYLGKIVTAILMLVLGVLGIATFVLGAAGRTTTWIGIAGVFLACVIIWVLIDFIFAVAGIMKDKEGKPIKNW